MKKLLLILLCFPFIGLGQSKMSKKSLKLSPEMSKEEVLEIMGTPEVSDFEKNVEEWFYCEMGMFKDKHLALYFHEGKLIKKYNYTSPAPGHCRENIKRGTYQLPDIIIELRSTY